MYKIGLMDKLSREKKYKRTKKEILCILLPPIFTFLMNSVVYWGAPLIKTGIATHNLSSSMDEIVPFMPQFILVYFGCYIFWVVNYLIIAAQKEEHRYQFFTADFYARLICFVCFVFFPTTNTRPELTGSDIFTGAVHFLYQIDKPLNLFPSIHCMASWFSCIGLRKCENVPKWYQNLSKFIAVLVFISTLALRQHVLIDVISGILVAEVTWQISRRTNGYQIYQRITEKLSDWLNHIWENVFSRKSGKTGKKSGTININDAVEELVTEDKLTEGKRTEEKKAGRRKKNG